MQPLPIDQVVEAVVAAALTQRGLVLLAPPGSGKSTRVPPALAEALRTANPGPGTAKGAQVYLLQPRRIAAKTLAARIAHERGWRLGEEVGYRVRHERVGGRDTRLWVMTEGSLTRQMQDDPYLDGVGAVILDEFHERNLHSDLALAWLRELQRTVRPELIIAVMSATIDPAPIAAFLGDAPVLSAPGRPFPVAVTYAPALDQRERLDERVARAVMQALEDPECGDVLAFLPGVGEIRGCERLLAHLNEREVAVLPLHGALSPAEQDRALSPAPQRKVVLATNVAETSVTIPGVRTVIDGGLARIARFNPDTGLDELHLEGISRYSAEQRAGRAGRTAPGRCIRLWSRLEDQRRPAATDAEIARVDLAPAAAALKSWHGDDTRAFPWYERPTDERLTAAEDLLAMLGLTVAPYAALTARGKRIAALPVHPRLGRLLTDAADAGQARLGASLAALVGERDVRMPRPRARGDDSVAEPSPADAIDRLDALAAAERARFAPHLRDQGIDPMAAREAARVRDDLLRLVSRSADDQQHTEAQPADVDTVIRLLLAAYPDRVGRRAVPDANRGSIVGGVAVEIDAASGLATRRGQPRAELFLAYAVQGLGGRRTVGQATIVRQGAELDEALIEAVHPGALARRTQLTWNDQAQRVDALIGWFYRDLCLRLVRDGTADPDAIAAFLATRLKAEAAALIAADADCASWLQRLRWLRAVRPELDLPALDEADINEMIDALCLGCRARAEVVLKPKQPWLAAKLSYAQNQLIEREAPSHVVVPSGSRMPLDYANATAAQAPILAVRLQEMFGLPATPRIADGRVPVLLHLLGPNYRCEQVTTDLASFWANTYPQVRKDLRARYLKHSWPDDPLAALAVAKGRSVKRN